MDTIKKVLSSENRIFKLASTGRRIPNGVILIFIAMFLMFVSELLAIPVVNMFNFLSNQGFINQTLRFTLLTLVIPFGMIILVVFSWVKLIEKRSVSTMGFEIKGVFKKYLRGFLIGIGLIAICLIVFSLFGSISINYSASSGFTALGGVSLVLLGWIVQGAAEEVIVRGWLFPMIAVKHNVIIAIIVSASFFGLLHLGNPNVSLLPLVNLILYGVLASVYVLWEGGLWGICALHSAWNWAQGNLFGFEVSGTVPAGGTLINFNILPGYDLFTGGNFGIEGGLVCSFVLIIAIIILSRLISRRVAS